MRILIYSPYSLKFSGGGEHWIVEISSRLAASGHKIIIVTTSFGRKEAPSIDLNLSENITLIELPFVKSPGFGLLLPLPVCFLRLHRLLKCTDAVYFNNVIPLQELIVLGIKFIYKKAVINMYQAPLYVSGKQTKVYRRIISSHIVRFFDGNHILNEADRQILIKWQARNIHYIPNGVEVDKFRPCESGQNGNFKVLFVGRLNYHKGFDLLVEIIREINQDKELSAHLEFSIIGSGFWECKAKDLERQYYNVKYMGQIKHELLVSHYSRASLLIVPSRWEGMPLAALEAQACGLPIVGADIPGLREIALNNESISLIPPQKPAVFAEEVVRYYNLWRKQKDVYERLRHSARNNVLGKYDWDNIAVLTLKLINGL